MPRAPIAAPQRGPAAPLYRKLRPRPNGPPRASVIANQRARICGAMIEAVAAKGYAAVSVAGLCRLAGVSKRTYYELFPNRDACFLATYDAIVACAGARIVSAQSGGEWEEELRAAIGAMARAVEERPKAARLACVEARSAGPTASARCDRTCRELGRILARGFARAPLAARLPPLLPRGVACGIERVLRLSLLDSRRFEAEDVACELADWALCFASPALAGLPRSVPSCLDSLGNVWAPARARKASERPRVLRAAAEIVASAGHSRLTAANIARRAQVREEVVLELYPRIEDCRLDALELVGLEALVSIAKASRGVEDGPSGVCLAVRALMELLAGDPTLCAVAFLEPLTPGAASDRRERLLDCTADLITKPIPLPRGSRVTADATAGALWGLVHRHVVSGAAQMLPGLVPQAAYIALAPLLGAQTAVEAIAAEWPEGSARTSFR